MSFKDVFNGLNESYQDAQINLTTAMERLIDMAILADDEKVIEEINKLIAKIKEKQKFAEFLLHSIKEKIRLLAFTQMDTSMNDVPYDTKNDEAPTTQPEDFRIGGQV